MATTIPARTLRLLLALIRYRAKARKEMRREPPMVPRRRARKKAQCQANARPTRCHANARRGKHRDPAGLARPAICCTVWRGSITGAYPSCTLIYLIIIGGLCICCIAFVGIGQINGNATVKPCALFCDVGGSCMDNTKRAVNACMGCIAAGQNKSPAPSADARQKKSPASVGGVGM